MPRAIWCARNVCALHARIGVRNYGVRTRALDATRIRAFLIREQIRNSNRTLEFELKLGHTEVPNHFFRLMKKSVHPVVAELLASMKKLRDLAIDIDALGKTQIELLRKINKKLGTTPVVKPANSPSSVSQMPSATPGMNVLRIGRLSTKQLASVLAYLAGVPYRQVAAITGVDDSTIKIHVRDAFRKLDFASREHLRLELAPFIASMRDGDFEATFRIPKRWWESPSPALLAVLAKKKTSLPPARVPKGPSNP